MFFTGEVSRGYQQDVRELIKDHWSKKDWKDQKR